MSRNVVAGGALILGIGILALPAPAGAPFGKEVPAGPPSRGTALPPGATTDWLAAVEQSVARDEYAVTWRAPRGASDLEPGFQAPNRAHGLRTHFTSEGIRICPRKADAAPWEVGLSLSRIGVEGQTRAAGAGRIVAEANRVEYVRDGFVEWYVNDDRGLEQGFTLNERPAEAAGRGAFRLELAVLGNTNPRLLEDGGAVVFEHQGRPVLRYDNLRAWDARGREIPSRMEISADALSLVLDAEGAEYPVTVDPIATSPVWTQYGGQSDSTFGAFLDSAGDVNGDGYSDVIIGAPYFDTGQVDAGRAFVFHGSPSGPSSTPDWTSDGSGTGFVYGVVAGAGDVNGDGYADVIVGAPGFTNGETNEGQASVYLGSASGLSATPVWTEEGNQVDAYFGRPVAGAGDVNGDGFADVMVAATGFDAPEVDEGRVFVFFGSSSGPTGVPWTAESNQAGAFLGDSVRSAGNVNGDGFADVVIGAPSWDLDATFTANGRVFVYHGSATGLPGVPNRTLDPPTPQTSGQFGSSVSTAGDVNGDGFSDLLVGQPWYDASVSVWDVGRAQLYLGGAGGVASSPIWTATSSQLMGWFGWDVSSAGDVNGDGFGDWLVGMIGYSGGQIAEGAAFLYQGSISPGSATAVVIIESNQTGAQLGLVASAGDVNGDGLSDVLIDALNYDDTMTNEGRVTLHFGTPNGLSTTEVWSVESNDYGGELGWSIDLAGDVNGDGYTDVLLGAPGVSGGRLYVFHGSATGLPASASWTYATTESFSDDTLGRTVASAGDVNGDGYADIIAGDFLWNGGEIDEGRAIVFHGSPSGLSATPDWSAELNQAVAHFGFSVSGAGDVNGDGYADVIVGAQLYDGGVIDEGGAFLYLGSPSGLSSTSSWFVTSGQTNSRFGWSVSGAGDVNGDGYAEVAVGSRNWDNGEVDEGRVSLFLGGPTGPPLTSDWTAEGNQANAHFGDVVGRAGDVNGDGYADVVVVASDYDNGQIDEGRVFVYHGSVAGLPASASWTFEHNSQPDGISAAATAGDINADGFADLVVGAYRYGFSDVGQAFLFHGSSAGLQATPNVQWTAGQADSGFGNSVASAGDVNGDGFADVLVAAFRWTSTWPTEANEGRVFLYSSTSGRPVLSRSLRGGSGVLPVPPWGRTHDADDFKVRLTNTSPFGRIRVKIEVEACPPGVSFGSPSCVQDVSPTWQDVTPTAGGVTEEFALTGLASRRLYRWRARTLYAPFRVTEPGITEPPRPAHGPWRRLHAQALEADLRTDQGILLEFTLAGSSVPETAGSAFFTVRLTTGDGQPTLYDVSVQYQTADGSATAGNDYLATSGPLTWSAGDSSGATRSAGVSLIGDATYEGDETFTVSLSSPVNAALGATSTHTVTIVDDDPIPSITIGDAAVLEGDSGTVNLVFPVSLSNPSAQTVGVDYSTTDITATSFADYEPASSNLAFPPGSVSGSVTLTVYGDTFPEDHETLRVDLALPTNATIADSLAIGTITNDDGPAGDSVSVFTVTAKNGENTLEWLYPSGYDTVRIHYTSGPVTCTFPTDPEGSDPSLGDVSGSPGQPGVLPHSPVTNGFHYCYTIWVKKPGNTFSAGKNTRGRPFDNSAGQPEEPVLWAYSTGATTVTPIGMGATAAYIVSNDHFLHSVVRGGGGAGGTWPTTPATWKPWKMGGPAQSRPPVVPTPVVPGSVEVVFVTSQDGSVYAIDAKSGAPRWQRVLEPSGSIVQAGAAGIFSQFGGPVDQILVGTRHTGGGNRFYALSAATGEVVNWFNNGGGASDIGFVSGGGAVDYSAVVDPVTRRAYFTSREGGSSNTLWAFNVSPAGLSLTWTRALGDIDASPTLRSGRLYVGSGDGLVRAIDATLGPGAGSDLWTVSGPFNTFDGPVKGFVFPDRLTTDLFISANNLVFSLRDDGDAYGINWVSFAVPAPSVPVFGRVGGVAYVFVGGSNGRLYEIDAATGASVKSVLLGDGLAVVGAPSLDLANGVVYVGTDAGIVYAVQVPLR